MPVPFPFDWRNPDYVEVFEWRMERLERIRTQTNALPDLKLFYRNNPAQFIIDWGVTFDPRNSERGLPTIVPFILFPKQEDCVNWFLERWRKQEDGIIEKSRDMGISWLFMGIACTFCIFMDQVSIGCGSRKEELVDASGDPDSLMEKARIFVQNLPVEFRAGWERRQHGTYMKLTFPESGSIFTGEAGSDIGRGGRQAWYLIDEAAHLQQPLLVENAISQTTNCCIKASTPKGMQNPFAVQRHSGRVPVFTFHWRDDPRKDDAWYASQKAKKDPVTVAQEIDCDYAASVEGVLIPSDWIQSCIDACQKLGIAPSGIKSGALDVADEGKDKNAFAARYGVELTYLEEWSGVGLSIFRTTQKAFTCCDMNGCKTFQFDSDGLGVGVRGDAEVINEGPERRTSKREAIPFRGSQSPVNPDDPVVKEDQIRRDLQGDEEPVRTNKDFFANRKAQAWWSLRTRIEKTHWAVTEGREVDPDEILSIPKDLPSRAKLVSELSQPTYTINNAGKVLVNKQPDGMPSPNLADAVMILFSPQQTEPPGFFGV